MIGYHKHILNNGLRVIVNEDDTTPLAAVNIMYDVGARDEQPGKTGFAHLFEHFMFSGSKNIPKYDEPLEKLGGHNNAFTNNDVTNYYCTLPVGNIETAFWLESDRMLDLRFTESNLEVQKNVITEEFRQMYLNQPYGDVWLILRPMAYKVHPYQWPTIGKSIEHIKDANMQEVRDFYQRFYNPNNAVLCVSGNIKADKVFRLAEKWFGSIQNRGENKRTLPEESKQKERRSESIHRDVPLDAIFMAFHMESRLDPQFYASDLLSDILSNGNSSRLFQQLIKQKKLFSEINAFITGDIDNGLLVVHGSLIRGVAMKEAEQAIQHELQKIMVQDVAPEELEKVKNKVESALIMAETKTLNKAINLSYYELLGDAGMNNELIEKYRAVTVTDIKTQANKIFRRENSNSLYYYSNHKQS